MTVKYLMHLQMCRDPESITPSHLLHGRRISMLPHSTVHDDELCDPDFGDVSEIRRKVKHFGNRWRKEYLTALRESHKPLVLIHNERELMLF